MFYILIILLATFSMIPNINEFAFRFEETTRAVVAFEMYHSGNYFQPTILGDPYYNKPPLFNWFIIISSKFFGWDIVTARAVSVFFTLANAFLIYFFSSKVLKNKEKALLSSVFFITFADVLFWYGWLAEIDVTLSFFVTLLFIQIYKLWEEGKPIYYYTSALLTGLIFMIKGFPAFAFYGLSLISLSIFKRDFKVLLNFHAFASYFLALIASFWWLPFSENPEFYFRRLWEESFSRVESSKDLEKFLIHLITYPLLNVKQLLPASLFVIPLIFTKRISLPRELKFLLFLVIFNYIPYIISATSRGRYVLPLFPILAVIFAHLIHEYLSKNWKKVLLFSLIFVIILRFIYGIFFLPYVNHRKGEPKLQAKVAYELTKTGKVACDCPKIKDFCLYIGFLRGEPLLRPKYTKAWDYLVDCKERKDLSLIKKFYVNKKEVYLYGRFASGFAINTFNRSRGSKVFEGMSGARR
ncbi:ArnT family glycosyltransferase [Aquifex aeolicus]|uniref:Glycosyltransferase RgtA/B/C/D-like domain-containing protein n=1 Tax=Aquifex aeolicus (strain VF5) TaxID=224324 RepID=O67281_AQUAE|nr:glycosyltransferase family 39 protein [Aquifex aeolicus]AAC07253.1 hypothetical protein aq_1236 [Aquifex aeolicus VF5]